MPTVQTTPATAFPIPLTAFLAKIRGTKDEVWGRLLKIHHGREKRTEADWRAAIGKIASTPAGKAR